MAERDEQRARLDELEEKIERARERAEDAIPQMEDDEQRWHESGTVHPEQDDQTAEPA